MANILLGAVLGAQTIATLIAVYGVFMAPIGWKWALGVWAFDLAWFLVYDRLKFAAYKIFYAVQPGLLAKHIQHQA
jgi:H+-transporting ATPase